MMGRDSGINWGEEELLGGIKWGKGRGCVV